MLCNQLKQQRNFSSHDTAYAKHSDLPAQEEHGNRSGQFKKTIQMLHGNKAMFMINDVEWCAMMLLTYDIQFINDTIEFFQDLYLMWKAILI
ncbi:hypothetical protein CIAN88_13570 [[Clostridium] innocuum]|uniref:Uncharacterized protein n=1 Tax=Clostridium innocuum TaxID=1522 RepID=A0A099I4R0_CLOIN|nr:hypothetical protein CIAN88_13570 [[Clostridium] innocuum]